MRKFSALLPCRNNEKDGMMTSYPPCCLPAPRYTAVRVTVSSYDFISKVGGIERLFFGWYSWVRRQSLFEPQQIRLDKVLHISKFLLKLCHTLIMEQFGNLTNLLGVSPITLHIHNVIIEKRVPICSQFHVHLITQKIINQRQLKNQQKMLWVRDLKGSFILQ